MVLTMTKISVDARAARRRRALGWNGLVGPTGAEIGLKMLKTPKRSAGR
jgi:hypothetical protein